jgi:hypothetical protein
MRHARNLILHRPYHGDSKKDGVAAQQIDEESGIFIRTEYQTLRRLAVSGDILFTIRILIQSSWHIKGLANTRMQVIGRLEQMAGSGERRSK